jgi:hypothetical protein
MTDNELWVKVWLYPTLIVLALIGSITIYNMHSNEVRGRIILQATNPMAAACAYDSSSSPTCVLLAK